MTEIEGLKIFCTYKTLKHHFGIEMYLKMVKFVFDHKEMYFNIQDIWSAHRLGIEARFFLLVDLRGVFSDLGSGGTKKIK